MVYILKTLYMICYIIYCIIYCTFCSINDIIDYRLYIISIGLPPYRPGAWGPRQIALEHRRRDRLPWSIGGRQIALEHRRCSKFEPKIRNSNSKFEIRAQNSICELKIRCASSKFEIRVQNSKFELKILNSSSKFEFRCQN